MSDNQAIQEIPEDSIPLRIVVFTMAVLCVVASCVFVRTTWWMTTLYLVLICAGSFLSYKFRHPNPRWMAYIWWIGILLVGVNAMYEFTGPLRDEFDFVSPFVHFLCGIFAFVTFSMRSRSDLNTATGLGLILICLSAPVAKGLPYGACVLGYLSLGAVMMYFDCVSRTLTSWLTHRIIPAPEVALYNKQVKKGRIPRGNTIVLVSVVPLLALAMFLYVPRADEFLDKIWAYSKTMKMEYLTDMFYKSVLQPPPPKDEHREHTGRQWFNKHELKQLPMTGKYAPKTTPKDKEDKAKKAVEKAREKAKQEEKAKKEKEKAEKEKAKEDKKKADEEKGKKAEPVVAPDQKSKDEKAKPTKDPKKDVKLTKDGDKDANQAETDVPSPAVVPDDKKGKKEVAKDEKKDDKPAERLVKTKAVVQEELAKKQAEALQDQKNKPADPGAAKDGAVPGTEGGGEKKAKVKQQKKDKKGNKGGGEGAEGKDGEGGNKEGDEGKDDNKESDASLGNDAVLKLGDKQKADNRLVFTVKSRRLVYLRRQCFDYYTGLTWKRTAPPKKKGEKDETDKDKGDKDKADKDKSKEASEDKNAVENKDADSKDAVSENKDAEESDTTAKDAEKKGAAKGKDAAKDSAKNKIAKGKNARKKDASKKKDAAKKKDADSDKFIAADPGIDRIKVVDGVVKKEAPKKLPPKPVAQVVPRYQQYPQGIVKGSQPSVFGNTTATGIVKGSQPSVFGNTNPQAPAPEEPKALRVEEAQKVEVKEDDTSAALAKSKTVRPFLFESTERPIFKVGMADALTPVSTLPTVELVQEIRVKAKTIGNVIPGGWIPQELKLASDQNKVDVDTLGVMTSSKPITRNSEIKVKTELPIYPIDAMRQEMPLAATEEDELRERFKQYLQLPETTSEEMFKVAENNSDPRYNWFVQAEQICNYLRDNFEYDGTRSVDPNSKDLVDDFLFNRGIGNSNDFASTFVVLTRCVGIPSRIVNGFAPGEHNPVTGEQEVRMKHQLVWAEVYIPEFGWVPFDAHPDGVLPAQKRENRYTQKEVEKQLGLDKSGAWGVKWTDVITYGVAAIVSLVVGVIAFKLLIALYRRWRRGQAGRGPEWRLYKRVAKAVKKSMKLTRAPTETPTEFIERVQRMIDERKTAGKVAPEALPEALASFLRYYSAVYFGRQMQEMEHLKYHADRVVKVSKSVKMKDIEETTKKSSAVRRKDEFKDESSSAASSAVRRRK
jgi:hypothetical protein